jgi:FdhE protein
MAPDAGPWPARIARARQLAQSYPAAAEALTFYAELATFQQGLLYEGSSRGCLTEVPHDGSSRRFVETLDQPQLRALVPELLQWLRGAAPRRLAVAAEAMLAGGPAERDRMFETYWATAGSADADADDTRAFVVEAALQPFAESLAASWRPEAGPSPVGRCPVCAGRPVVGLLREAGHGARRELLCGLCNTEWRSPRVTCPACGEGRFDALSVIRADQFPNLQVDVCSTCRTYVKTLDLTRDNTAVPAADDLASLPLDLWAREQGYSRLRPHLLRI